MIKFNAPKLKILVVVLLFILCGTTLAFTQEEARINIAVFDFKGINISEMESATISEFLRTGLINSGSFNVVEKENMEKILNEAAFQQSGCTSDECAIQIGKILNVKKMVVGSVSQSFGMYYINLRFVDVEKATSEFALTEEAETGRELVKSTARLVDGIVAKMTGRQQKEEAVMAPKAQAEPKPEEKIILPASLDIKTDPAGLSIRLDGEDKGLTPAVLENIPAGMHKLRLYGEHSGDTAENITLSENQKLIVRKTLPKYGYLSVKTDPDRAEILLNGSQSGYSPMEGKKLPEGSYKLKIRKKGYLDTVKELEIYYGKVAAVEETLGLLGVRQAKGKGAPGLISWTCYAAGAVLGGMGLYFNSSVKSSLEEYKASTVSADAQVLRIEVTSAQKRRNLSYIFSGLCLGLGFTINFF